MCVPLPRLTRGGLKKLVWEGRRAIKHLHQITQVTHEQWNTYMQEIKKDNSNTHYNQNL